LGRFEEAEQLSSGRSNWCREIASVHLNLANMGRFKPGDRRLPGFKSYERVDTLERRESDWAQFLRWASA